MQDGAASCTTDLNINFLNHKFQARVFSLLIAIRTHKWPPLSPDLNHIFTCLSGVKLIIIVINTLFSPDKGDQDNGNIQLMESTKQKHISSYYSFYKDLSKQ